MSKYSEMFPINSASFNYTEITDPLVTINPTIDDATWLSKTTGEIFACVDRTIDMNHWIGQLGTEVKYILSNYFETKIMASDGEAGDKYGASVGISMDGLRLIVGAYAEDTGRTGAGAAYIYEKENNIWVYKQKIQAADRDHDDEWFGLTSAIDGDFCIVGCRADASYGTGSGAAYIFLRNESGTWDQLYKLYAPDAAAGDLFGFAVDIKGNDCIVGAATESTGGTSAGAAYVFVHDVGWTHQQKLMPDDITGSDWVGGAVAIHGDYCIISSSGHDSTVGAADQTGAAYVFFRSGITWTQQQKLEIPGNVFNARFGAGIALFEDTCIISQYATDTILAHIFVRNGDTWTLEQTLQPTGSYPTGLNICSVAISKDICVLGTTTDNVDGEITGSVHIFTRVSGVWTEVKTLTASDKQVNDSFGSSVDITNTTCITGAINEDSLGIDAGAVYIYE